MEPGAIYWEYKQIQALEYERNNPGKRYQDNVVEDSSYKDYQRSLGIEAE